MKKSVKEQVEILRKKERKYVLRIIRRALNEAYERGVAAVGYDYMRFSFRSEQRQAVSEIMNGPKKTSDAVAILERVLARRRAKTKKKVGKR